MIEREILESSLHLTYRRDLEILFLRWFRSPDSEHLRQGYLQALELAKEVQSGYCMFDLRSRGRATEEDESWLLQTYFPLVEEELGRQNFIANLVTPTHYAYICSKYGIDFIESYGTLTKLAVFTSEQEAIAWLLKSRADR